MPGSYVYNMCMTTKFAGYLLDSSHRIAMPIGIYAGLEITGTGKVYGNITVGSLQIERGGIFRGQSFMGATHGEPEPLLLSGPAFEGENFEER